MQFRKITSYVIAQAHDRFGSVSQQAVCRNSRLVRHCEEPQVTRQSMAELGINIGFERKYGFCCFWTKNADFSLFCFKLRYLFQHYFGHFYDLFQYNFRHFCCLFQHLAFWDPRAVSFCKNFAKKKLFSQKHLKLFFFVYIWRKKINIIGCALWKLSLR